MSLSSKNLIVFLSFVVFFISSLHHIHAREFNNNPTTNTIPNNKEDQEPASLYNQHQEQEQDPNTFIPQTQYPYKSTTESDQYPFQNPNTHNSNYLYNKEAYVSEQPQGMSDTRFMHRGYNNHKYNGGNSYNTQLVERGYNGNNNYYNGGNRYHHPIEKQGMSDTRFLENGKYYYDLESESKYNQRMYQNSRGVSYSDKGYSGNSYQYNTNSMDGYQNQGKYQDDQFMH